MFDYFKIVNERSDRPKIGYIFECYCPNLGNLHVFIETEKFQYITSKHNIKKNCQKCMVDLFLAIRSNKNKICFRDKNQVVIMEAVSGLKRKNFC